MPAQTNKKILENKKEMVYIIFENSRLCAARKLRINAEVNSQKKWKATKRIVRVSYHSFLFI